MLEERILKKIADKEGVSVEFLKEKIKEGRIVVPWNTRRQNITQPVAIGECLRVKVNTNIGTSTERQEIEDELQKLAVAIKLGTDTVMDLSVGGNLREIRRKVISTSSVPVGTVPIYEAAWEVEKRKGSFDKMKIDDVMAVIEEQAEDGVDFFTIHAGILKKTIDVLVEKKSRVGGIVSRGGAILARWMYVNKKENLLYENFDRIIDIAKKYNITISLGDALRPGSIADSTDKFQIEELFVLSELVRKCRKKGVQVMVEGPGHIRLDEIELNVALEKKLCEGAPFYVLGPLPTDIACGYDHIVSAIGGALISFYGADFLCVVTPAEHLRHPSVQDVEEGVVAAKIAAHTVDLLRFKKERERDYQLSFYRARREWDKVFSLSLDGGEKAKQYREPSASSLNICTMCGEFCSLKMIENCCFLK